MRHKNKADVRPCRVYWGTHGCRKQRGHLGKHLCAPGCRPANEYDLFYGEDALYGRNIPCPALSVIEYHQSA